MDNLGHRLQNLLDQNYLVALLSKTLLALLLLLLFLVVGRLLRSSVRRVTARTSRNANLPILLSNLTYVIILIVAALAILSIYTDQSFSTLLTLLGLLSLAISLSVQDVLKNFVAGVYLLLEQPFSIGDRIKVHDVEGKVENIEIRTTSVHTDDGLQIYIPNSMVFSEIVTNRTAYRQRLSTVRLTCPIEHLDFAEASRQVLNVMKGFEPSKVSPDPAPEILVDGVSDGNIQARLNFWSPNSAPLSTDSEVILALYGMLPRLGINAAVAAIVEASPK